MFRKLKERDLPYQGKRKKKKEKTEKKPVAPGKTSIEARPAEVLQRRSFGHWEMDSVIGKREKGETMIVLTERLTRQELIFRSRDKSSISTIEIIDGLERAVGAECFSIIFKSITCDNGCELMDEMSLRRSVIRSDERTQIYYCHPFCSGERGSNEKNNQMIRRFIKKSTKIEFYSDGDLKRVMTWINNYPRPTHGGKTSQMMFEEQIRLLGIPLPEIFKNF